MCGIFAYLTYHEPRTCYHIIETLLEGLRSMEYAGCDSSGLVLDKEENARDSTALIRCIGNVDALRTKCYQRLQPASLRHVMRNNVGLGHTRWATHGAPNETNAHPQPSGVDCGFLVVHNGIIPNYQVIRTRLESSGHAFASDTDTECIAKLCQHFFTVCGGAATFPELVLDVVSQLQGPYGIVVKSKHFPGEMVAANRGSRLLMATAGLAPAMAFSQPCTTPEGGLEVFVASDAAALVPHSSHVVAMEDGDILHVSGGQVKLYNARAPLSALSPCVKAGLLATPRPIGQPPSPQPLPRRGLFAGPLGKPPALSPCCSPAPATLSPPVSNLQYIEPPPSPGTAVKPQACLRHISRQAQLLDMELDAIMKGAFPHFLLKEIFEQPESLKNTMRGRLSSRHNRVVLGGIAPYRELIQRARRIIFLATGSAFYGALAVRNVFEEMVQIPVQLELASDFCDRKSPIFRDDACCFISHTGENPDVLSALRYCRAKGALCIGVTNQVGSTLSELTDCGVYLHAGFELGVTSTKAFSSEVLVLLMMALMLSEDRRDVAAHRLEIINAMQELPGAVYAALQALQGPMEEVAVEFKARHNFLFMARGPQIATCLEGALKLNETARVHGEGIHLGELKHGPLALVDADMPVMVICTHDPTEKAELYAKAKSSLQQVLARRGRPIVIVNTEDEEIAELVHRVVRVPPVLCCLKTIINILPFQLLAYHLGVLHGMDVDGPRYCEN